MTTNFRTYRLLFQVLVLSVVIISCVDRFTPEIEGLEQALIIDGLLSNDNKQQEIRLLRSAQEINDPALLEVGAFVQVVDAEGQVYPYQEIEPGFYQSIDSGIGVSGKTYHLEITTSDGKQYTSIPQVMKDSESLEQVYTEIEEKYFYDDASDIPGYRFYVDGPAVVSDDSYFVWLQSATYKYRADYPIDFSWSGGLTQFPNRDSLTTCYKDIAVRSVSTFGVGQLSGNGVKAIPLNFLRADEQSISVRYSLLVKQYSINKEAYTFWNGIEAQLNSNADLYTSQPYEIRGNISNVEDEEELVLGFFTVGAVTERRIFVNPPDVEIPYKAPCAYDYMAYGYINVYGPSDWPIYVAQGPEGGLALLGDGCLDCRELGGVLKVPEFWEE